MGQVNALRTDGFYRSEWAVRRIIKVVLEGYTRYPDNRCLINCRHLHDLGRHIAAKNHLPPISLTVPEFSLHFSWDSQP